MRYVIYGAGAVGGVIGGNLHRAGIATTLIARGDHLRALQKEGLTLDTAQGTVTLPVPALGSIAEVTWTDDTVVLLCVKGQQTAAALDDLLAHAPADTPIVAVQNGVANEPAILRRFPRAYGVHVILPATHLVPGVVVQDSAAVPGLLDVGRYPDGVDDIAEAIAGDLTAAGFASVPRADIMAWKYRKLVNNLGNGVDAIARPGSAADELVRRCRAEGEAAFAAAGIRVVSAAADRERRAGTIQGRLGGKGGSSTWQSISRGAGSVEIDYLAGEVVLLGRLHGVPTPANELVQRTAHQLVRAGGDAGSLDAADLLEALDRR
ncbi:ketopantoate reductase family protein [Nocardioides sp. DS6]|uniref:Ketopantoate reductase family protein n=1 Tax=Nocardioides eburneus TaxID=3231482 RepID=A0ABV3SUS0_9ACTN